MQSNRIVSVILTAVAAVAPAMAQSVISAKSGTLHFIEGQVKIDGETAQVKAGVFPVVREQSILMTDRGRAEILLTPGVFLRVSDYSSVRMLDASLSHTLMEVVGGDVMLEADDPQINVKNEPVTLVFREMKVSAVKHGLVEINTLANQVKVFRGEAEVTVGDKTILLKEGHFSELSGDIRSLKFNADQEQSTLLAWSKDRSAALSAANMYAAGTIKSGPAYGYTGGTWNGGWFYNNAFDMFTFVPAGGLMWNPWGYGFYSPGTIFGYYGVPVGWFRATVPVVTTPVVSQTPGSGTPAPVAHPARPFVPAPQPGMPVRQAFAAAARSTAGGWGAGAHTAASFSGAGAAMHSAAPASSGSSFHAPASGGHAASGGHGGHK